MAIESAAAPSRLEASEASPAIAVVTPRALLAVFVPAILLLNVANAIAVFLYHHRHHHGGRFFQEFSLDREANVPSWFSSALLLTAAAVLALVALDALARNARWGRHWAGLSLVFVVLSLDE